MSTFDINGYVFPLVSGYRDKSNNLKINRFEGCGFYLNKTGLFATCKHIIKGINEEHGLYISDLCSKAGDDYYATEVVFQHEEYDLAICQAHRQKSLCLPVYNGEFGVGLDVQSFGYTNAGIEEKRMFLDARLMKGHISRLAETGLGYPTPKLCEVSFPSPSGFSGTALITEWSVVGMMYGNAESSIEAYSFTEVKDGNETFKESVHRVIELGLAHPIYEILKYV